MTATLLGVVSFAAVAAGTSSGSTGPATQGNPTTGKPLFSANCAACHTLKAAGAKGTIGPDLDTVKLPEATIINAISNGGSTVMTPAAAAKYSTSMVAYKGVLSTAQIENIAAFVYVSTHPTTAPAKPKPAPKKPPVHVTVKIGTPKATSCTVSRGSVATGTVIFTIVNEGKTSRFFEVNGKKTALIAPHKSATLTVSFSKAGHYSYTCVAKGTLKVT